MSKKALCAVSPIHAGLSITTFKQYKKKITKNVVVMLSATGTPDKSNSIKSIAASSCPRLVGNVAATAVVFTARFETSGSGYLVVSVSPRSNRSTRLNSHYLPRPLRSALLSVFIDLRQWMMRTSLRLTIASRSISSSLHATKGASVARSNLVGTGKRRKPKSRRFTRVSQMSVKICCTKQRQHSAKTTRSSVLRICRYKICPSLPSAANNRAKWWRRSTVWTDPALIRVGVGFDGN